MGDGMQVPYPADVRQAAKEKAPYCVGLACIDIYPFDGVRITAKGPCSKRDLEELTAFWMTWNKNRWRRWARREKRKPDA